LIKRWFPARETTFFVFFSSSLSLFLLAQKVTMLRPASLISLASAQQPARRAKNSLYELSLFVGSKSNHASTCGPPSTATAQQPSRCIGKPRLLLFFRKKEAKSSWLQKLPVVLFFKSGIQGRRLYLFITRTSFWHRAKKRPFGWSNSLEPLGLITEDEIRALLYAH
jgi:hypothetical protein